MKEKHQNETAKRYEYRINENRTQIMKKGLAAGFTFISRMFEK